MQQHHDLVADHSLKMHRESSISSVRPSAQIETVTILPVSERMDSKYGVIPYPENTEFHGREDILLQLYSTLVKGASPSGMPHKQRSVALCGMGGVGKTQIALKYLYTYYNSYTAIFWVNADTVEKLNEGFSEIARALELPVTKLSEKTEITELVRDVKRWLRQTDAKWLMIFDNADDLTALRDYLPEMKGHIIITSRNRTAGRPLGSQRIEVSPLSTSEGTELFHFLLSRKTSNTSTSEIQDAGDPIAAEKLVKEMGALPLAIAQATGYISRTGVSISGYLDTYKKQGDDLSKLEFGDDLDAFYERTVATTLELSVLHIQKQSIEATYLLNILSLLDPDNIPDTLFTEGGRAFQNSDSFLAFLSDKIQYNNASGTLVQFSLIDRRNGVMAMHRLLQKVVVRRMKLEDKLEIFDNTVRLVAKVFPATDTSSLWGFWDDARLYLPHCVKMQGHYNNFANHSTLQELAALFVECGKYLRERGVCSESIPMLSIARDISQKVYGWGSIQYATCCYALGRAHLEEMHLEKAIENFRTAAQTQETLLGPEARKTADSYNDWGIALHEDGQLDEAEQRYTHRLRIYEKLLGPDDPYTASSYNNLAMVALARNDPQAAVSLTRRSLRIQIRNFGENHPYIPKTRNYLAYGLRAIGKLEEAAELHRKAMVYQEANKGPRHINTATSVQGLANVLHDQGFLDEATALYFRVVDIRADALRLYHPDRVVAYKNLIILLCKQDQADEAEAVLRGIKPLIQADTTQSEQTSMNLTIDLSDIITLAYADPEGFRKRPLEVNYVKHQH
jgi:tetratricopeptide (TPR) repeat protein